MKKIISIRTLSALAATGLGAVVLAAPGTAAAGESSANLTVTAEVEANCLISANPLDFGSYDPIDAHATAPLDASANLDVVCTNGAAAKIVLDEGESGSGRAMSNGSYSLEYELYSNAGRSAVWSSNEENGVDYTGTGLVEQVTVYGRIPAGQNVPADVYSDTVVATIIF